MFEVVQITNPLNTPYIHSYEGKAFKLMPGSSYNLPYAVARDVAYHLAQRVCNLKGIPLFGADYEKEINKLMGIENPADLPKDQFYIDEDAVEEYGNTPEAEVFELPSVAPTPTAFSPAEPEGVVASEVLESEAPIAPVAKAWRPPKAK